MDSNTELIRDKYRDRERDSVLKRILELMLNYGVTVAELNEYSKVKYETTLSKVVKIRNKNAIKERQKRGSEEAAIRRSNSKASSTKATSS